MAGRIHIIHMNDLHSRFEHMPKIATYVKQVKEMASKKHEPVIVVDLGDHMDRMHYETEGTYGKVNVEILNETGVQFATIGNNEGLTFTKEMLANAYRNRKFKILTCNLRDLHTGQLPEWALPYTIEKIGDLTIGWIGATAPYETFYRLQEWKVEDPLPIIQEIVNGIKSKVDIIILLSHLGIKADEQIAEMIPDIHLILGGHTHRFFEKGLWKGDSTLICQVGIFGQTIGHVIIEYQNDDANKRIKMKEQTIPIHEFPDDPNILALLEKNRKTALKELEHTIAILDRPLPISLERESPLANLLADGVKRWVNAEIGIVNTGQLLAGLEPGKVTKKKIHEICPSPINACKITLTGKQIKILLEEALLPEKIHYPLKGYGFRGKELGTLAISGLLVEYDLMKQDYQKVLNITFHGEKIIEDKEYTIGTLDMFTFGGGYTTIKESIENEKEVQYFLPEFIRDILALQLQNQAWIDQTFEQRWINVSNLRNG
ncbi:bifunctional metallophosphatase/5'-nucleotidase [Tepidibacillus sp. LV47]|uniref:bifunctional metallophosphatase/5'-nucleotidase n=1 Tax=Tepidibacillus sp. LV47 TaxID=3398228 RepID=UPI003AACDA85